MNETNAERLERIKTKVENDGPNSLDYWGFVHEDMKFFIKQAERAQELEMYCEKSANFINQIELEKENKRLRGALNTIAWNFEATNPQAMFMKDTARQALEGKRDG